MNNITIITGAARNIGKGIAKQLLAEGQSCLLIDKNAEELQKVVKELQNTYATERCMEYVGDVSSLDDIEKLMVWLEQNNLYVDVLINNAAYESEDSVMELRKAELEKTSKTNNNGPFYLTSLFAKRLSVLNKPGNVVFISSTHSKIIRTHPLYSASKAAIEMFVKEAALELAYMGIRVNAVAPGPTQDTPELKLDDRVPLGYYQQPNDIAEAVSFLISDKARFITGQSLVVDGGYSLAHTHHWLKHDKFLRT